MTFAKLLLNLVVVSFLFSGCASTVKFSMKVPSLKENDPHAVIREENSSEDFVTTSIKGVYTNQATYPANLEILQSTGSTAGDISRLAFGFTPLGMLTHAVHHDKGRTIAVPPGKLGIDLNHHYRKTLSYERTGYKTEGTTTYEIWTETYEEKYWDSVFWVTLEQGKEYVFRLSEKKLIGPDGVVPFESMSEINEPAGEVKSLTKEVVKDKDQKEQGPKQKL